MPLASQPMKQASLPLAMASPPITAATLLMPPASLPIRLTVRRILPASPPRMEREVADGNGHALRRRGEPALP